MPKVKLGSVSEGMVVAVDVKNMDNMLLLPAGCVLTEKHIDILNAWGITELQVEAGGPVEEVGDVLEQLPPGTLEQLRGELAALFWEPIDKGPIQAEAFDLLLRRKAKQLANPSCQSPRREH